MKRETEEDLERIVEESSSIVEDLLLDFEEAILNRIDYDHWEEMEEKGVNPYPSGEIPYNEESVLNLVTIRELYVERFEEELYTLLKMNLD